MADDSGHTEQDLLEQWTFLDSMVERQASQLRAGIQDEDEEHAAAPVVAAPDPELATLRTRVGELERQCSLLEADIAAHRHESESSLQAAQAAVDQQLRAVAELRAQLVQRDELIATHAATIAARDAALRTYEARLTALQSESNDRTAAALAERDATIAALRQQQETMAAALAHAEHHLDLLRSQLAATHRQPAALAPPPATTPAPQPSKRWWRRS